MELIKNIVHSYRSNERTIYLTVLSAKSDHANRVISKRCCDVVSKGSMALGIITKSDFLPPSSENEKNWLDLAQNNE
jgi:hypothetical protein